jgi:hypothetical protein
VTAVEKLVVERIATAFLQLGHIKAREAQKAAGSLPWAKFFSEQQQRTNRQLMAAMLP